MRNARMPENRGGRSGKFLFMVLAGVAVVVIVAALYFSGVFPPFLEGEEMVVEVIPEEFPTPSVVSTATPQPTPIPTTELTPTPEPTLETTPTSIPTSVPYTPERPAVPEAIVAEARAGVLLASGWVDKLELFDGEVGTVWYATYINTKTNETVFSFVLYGGDPLRIGAIIEVPAYEAKKDPIYAKVTLYNPDMPERILIFKTVKVELAKSGTLTTEQRYRFADDMPSVFSKTLRFELAKGNFDKKDEGLKEFNCKMNLDPVGFSNSDGFNCVTREPENAPEALKQIRLLIERIQKTR